MRRLSKAWVGLLAASAVSIVAGIAALTFSAWRSASFGWFAYAPLPDPGTTISLDGFVLLTPFTIVGAVMAAIGLLGLGAAAGFVMGRGSGGPAASPSEQSH